MSCAVTVRLGVYALGADDEAERVLVESHLATCQECRDELALLEPLPGLLARVPVNLVRNPRAGMARASAWRLRSVASVAAAAMVGAVGGFWLAHSGTGPRPTSPPPAAITLSGANPATHVRVTITLAGTSWGTSIELLAVGLPLNQPCRLIVRSRAGQTEVAGTWDAWSTGPVSIPGSAGWRPQDISSLQVATPSRNLVTVTAARPAR